MATLNFKQSVNYPGHILLVPVTLMGAMPYTVQAVLDTGAGISMFNQGIALAVGITDIYGGTSREVRSASGNTETSYIHQVAIEILGRRLTIPIAFGTWNFNVLGMEGFFEQFVFGLDHRAKTFYV